MSSQAQILLQQALSLMAVDEEIRLPLKGGWGMTVRKMDITGNAGIRVNNLDPQTGKRMFHEFGTYMPDGTEFPYNAPYLTQDPDGGVHLADIGLVIPSYVHQGIRKQSIQQIVGMHICNTDGSYKKITVGDKERPLRFSMSNAMNSLKINVQVDDQGKVIVTGDGIEDGQVEGYIHTMLWGDQARTLGWAALVLPSQPDQIRWIEHEGLWLAAGITPAYLA